MDILLKHWTEADRDFLIKLGTEVDRTYLSGVPFPFREKDALWYIGYASKHDGSSGIWRCITVDGVPAGAISVNRLHALLKRDAQLGFYILPGFTDRGIMTRALRIMCHMAFQTLPIERITAPIISENYASRRVCEKNGFELEGTLRKAVWKNDREYDLVLYGKLREHK